MKLKDIKLTTGKISAIITYLQAEDFFNELISKIHESKYDLFYDSEELPEAEIYKKYCEINRVGSFLGLCCEYYLKYILLCTKIIDDPSIEIDTIWDNNNWKTGKKDKGIKRHTIIELLEKIDEFYPNFKNTALMVMINKEENKISNNGEIDKFNIQPFYLKYLDFQDEIINESISKYSDIFVDSRYMMESKKEIDLKKILIITENIRFLSHMIHIANDEIDINYGTAYIRAMLEEKDVYSKLLKVRTEKEIVEILNMNKICSNSKLLYITLTNNKISFEELKKYNTSEMNSSEIYYCILKKIGKGFEKYINGDISSYEYTLFGPISVELPSSLPKKR